MEQQKTDFFLVLPSQEDVPTILSDFYKQEMKKVVDETTGETSLLPEGDPYLVKNTQDYAIDILGTLYKPTGRTLTSPEGFEYPEQEAQPGWHVNIRLSGDAMRDTVEQLDAQYGVQPKTPARVWL